MNGAKIGKNITYCNGRIICGIKQELIHLFTVMIMNISIITIWSIFIFIYFTHDGMAYSGLIIYILFILSLTFLLKSFASDPGIIPRQTDPDDDDDEYDPYEEFQNIAVTDINNLSIPHIYTERYCTTCKIKRPPKVSHCHLCDNCVKDFDHHCNFIANCIGERNHKYFYFFVMLEMLFLFFISISSSLQFILILSDFRNGMLNNLMLLPYCFFPCIILIPLSLILYFYKIISQFITIILSLAGTFSLYFLFYYSKDLDLDFDINPAALIINYMCVPALLFIFPICYRQTKVIMYGLTVKQYESILSYKKTLIDSKSEKNDLLSVNSEKTECYVKKLEGITIKEKWKNFISFCLKPIPDSLLGNNSYI